MNDMRPKLCHVFPSAAARYRGPTVEESRRQREATYVASPCASLCATRLQKSIESMELIEAMELVQLREIEKEAGKPSRNHVPV